MERLFSKEVNKLKKELKIGPKGGKKKKDDSDDENQEADGITFEEKVAFAESVRKLSDVGLTKLVKAVKEKCEIALSDVDAERLQIKIDDIDKDSFSEIKKIVDQSLAQATEAST